MAAKRAEAAVTELDFEEYVNAHTENVSRLMVHSLLRVGSKIFFFFFFKFDVYFILFQFLNEARVISLRCLILEDDLVRLKERLAESKASQKILNWVVFELSKEKRDALGELEKAKADLATKDGDVKAVVDAFDEAMKEMRHLMG